MKKCGGKPDLKNIQHQVRLYSGIYHEHVLQYYGWHAEPNGDVYVAMELCDGGDVASKLRKAGRFEENAAGRLICETTLAVTKCL